MKRLGQYIILLVWVIVTAELAFAAERTASWNANPDKEKVIRYHVFRIDPVTNLKHFLAEAYAPIAMAKISFSPGTHAITVSAENFAGWGPFADPVVVEIPASEPIEPPDWTFENGILAVKKPTKFKITQFLTIDMVFWASYKEWHLLTPSKKLFGRIEIDTVK